jgi:hypothetical protein
MSPVLCKVLLATECKYCYKFGHTISHCAAKKKAMAVAARPLVKREPVPTVIAKSGSNIKNPFAALQEDSDDEDKEPVKKSQRKRKFEAAENFPTLAPEVIPSTTAPPSSTKMSFAAALATPAPVKAIKPSEPTKFVDLSIRPTITLRYNRCWADIEDDEE